MPYLQILTQVHVNGSFSICFYNLFFKHCNFNQHYFKGKLDVPCQATTFQYFWCHALIKTFLKSVYIVLKGLYKYVTTMLYM